MYRKGQASRKDCNQGVDGGYHGRRAYSLWGRGVGFFLAVSVIELVLVIDFLLKWQHTWKEEASGRKDIFCMIREARVGLLHQGRAGEVHGCSQLGSSYMKLFVPTQMDQETELGQSRDYVAVCKASPSRIHFFLPSLTFRRFYKMMTQMGD